MSQSNRYFAEVADQWDEIRSGYFTIEMRNAAIARLSLDTTSIVADIGTGTGFIAVKLAEVARKVYGFDASEEMLEIASKNLANFSNVSLQIADGENIPLPDQSLDAIFANMYLHHAQNPAKAIKEMARLLKPGGKICITDLDNHENTWFHEEMADLWLGFDRQEIKNWYLAADLEKIDIDCAEGTCDCTDENGNDLKLSIFVAIGQKTKMKNPEIELI